MITREAEIPAHIDLAFEEGVAVAINDVAMPSPELAESMATIAGNHGVGGGTVLTEAQEALLDACGGTSGVVRVRVFKGEHTILLHQ